MKVILAEKPSVAKDIAAVVGATTKRGGYFEGNDYAVTYAFGHLVTMAEPEEMNAAWGKPWRLKQLPMIPVEWKYRVVEKSAQQFNVIKKLFQNPATTSIICATDAGREGEHIFRLIYQLTGVQKAVERLWISSLTAEAIRDGLSKLRSSKDFDSLADAAAARSQADWVIGLNFTRAYTTINNQLCTIGRVQTPTLALIVDRQTAIDAFKSAKFYEILATFEPGFLARYITPATAEVEPQTRLHNKTLAQSIVKAVEPAAHGIVESIITTEKKTKAPALYDLLTLQKDANKRFGYTAQETLNIAQSLYEEFKLLSYPRTESRHLSTDMVGELPRILSVILKGPLATKEVLQAFAQENIVPGGITAALIRPKLTKSYVDDGKLTDHHAIIPTHNALPANLPDRQRNVYNLVATRFLSIFLPPEVRDETTAIITMADYLFRAKGFIIKEIGWTVLSSKASNDDEKEDGNENVAGEKPGKKTKAKDKDEDAQQLPPLVKGQQVGKRKVELKEGKTSAPKPYDDSSLLTAMKNAGQELDDEDLAAYMKQKGLGTPATRASIIERLLQTGYVERSKKALLPTEKGKALIGQVHAELKDIALTAIWEQRLADMQDGKLKPESFDSDIADLVRRILPDVTAGGSSAASIPPSDGSSLGTCPLCKKGYVRITAKGAGCNRWKEGCTFMIWKEQRGKELSEEQMKELVANGQTKVIKGFKKKDGSGKYDARLFLNEEGKIQYDIGGNDAAAQPAAAGQTLPPGSPGSGKVGSSASDALGQLGQCPQCQAGTVRQTPKGAGCGRWREGCTFTVWRTVSGKELTDEQIKDLVLKKRTELIKGFKKKDGSGTYDAYLVLADDFKTRLEFDNKRGPEPEPVGVAKTV